MRAFYYLNFLLKISDNVATENKQKNSLQGGGMEFIKFRVVNFKGAKDVTIDLSKVPRTKIHTLVGLNESGKTTLLEALSLMGGQPYDLKRTDPSSSTLNSTDYQSFIPVSERYNFNGSISLKSTLQFSEEDIEKVRSFLFSQLNYKLINLQPTFTIERKFFYKDSKFHRSQNTWGLNTYS